MAFLRITKEKDTAHVEFFLENAAKSLDSAQLLYKASTIKDVQAAAGLKDFDGSLWVINASYYSMFYMARSLLESEGIKLYGDQSIHALTFDALVHYFYLSSKLQKRLLELYEVAKDEAGGLNISRGSADGSYGLGNDGGLLVEIGQQAGKFILRQSQTDHHQSIDWWHARPSGLGQFVQTLHFPHHKINTQLHHW